MALWARGYLDFYPGEQVPDTWCSALREVGFLLVLAMQILGTLFSITIGDERMPVIETRNRCRCSYPVAWEMVSGCHHGPHLEEKKFEEAG